MSATDSIDESDDDSSDTSQGILPWITGLEAFRRYGKSFPVLRLLASSKKVRTKKVNGTIMYSTEDLEKIPADDENTSPETSMADLVRAAKEMLAVNQKHLETMFDKYMLSFDKLLKTAGDSIEKQNDHIMNLEKQALEMREATEKVFTLEHTRKMDELREERTRGMQTKALQMLQTTFGPWIAAKLGGEIPGLGHQGIAPTPDAATDPRLAQLGQAVVGMVVAMSDEKFQALSSLIPPEEFGVLAMIREGMKG